MRTPSPANTLIRLPEVLAMTGLSRTTLYRRVKAGTFPASVDIGDSNARGAPIAWPLDEVQDWIEQRKKARISAVA